ncbi:MAG: preprotein translocase subunit SecY [Acidobacteria bacterium]|nr:preprotein translocase subunit SecY [Acidobacteriota bacterium]MCB9399639.1 preprotein translocase subunit SecY [Acidobacteriota bacterium]
MEKFFESIKTVFQIPDLRNKVLFTFGILALYRLGCQVLVPGVNQDAIAQLFNFESNGILSMVNMFSGGALGNAAVFALGIMPYITASIILQILQKSVPYLERLSKEGEQGRNKINRYTRYLTVGFGLLHSYGITTLLLSMDNGPGGSKIIAENLNGNAFLFRVLVMATLTTGTILIMWMGEKITEKGIGNGISLIIFAGIVVRLPAGIVTMVDAIMNGGISGPILMLTLAIIVGVVIFVVFFELGIRKIRIQYAKRMSANGQMAGGDSYLPFKVNSGGVIPVIFSASVVQIPQMVQPFLQSKVQPGSFWADVIQALGYGRPFNTLIFFLATMFFAFFYVEMLFNPKDTAENLKKNGGFIPGIRPGKETSDYIEATLKRLTFWGGLYLSFVCILPMWINHGIQLDTLPGVIGDLANNLPALINKGTNVTLAQVLGGTSLLIVVSVALDFVQQVENQLIMRKYEGFTNRSMRSRSRTRRYA